MFLLTGSAEAKKKGLFSAREAAEYEEKMKLAHNPNDSGAGLVQVEIEMVKYFAKIKKKAKKDRAGVSKKQQKKAKKAAKSSIVERLQRIAELQQLRAATTFQGFWEISVSFDGGTSSATYYLHFPDVNETTDMVTGTVESSPDVIIQTFVGYERLDAVKISATDGTAIDEYYLFISGNTLNGLLQLGGPGTHNVTGTRLRGP